MSCSGGSSEGYDISVQGSVVERSKGLGEIVGTACVIELVYLYHREVGHLQML